MNLEDRIVRLERLTLALSRLVKFDDLAAFNKPEEMQAIAQLTKAIETMPQGPAQTASVRDEV